MQDTSRGECICPWWLTLVNYQKVVFRSTNRLDHVIESRGLRFGKVEAVYEESLDDQNPLFIEVLFIYDIYKENYFEISKQGNDTRKFVKSDMSDGDNKTWADALDF